MDAHTPTTERPEFFTPVWSLCTHFTDGPKTKLFRGNTIAYFEAKMRGKNKLNQEDWLRRVLVVVSDIQVDICILGACQLEILRGWLGGPKPRRFPTPAILFKPRGTSWQRGCHHPTAEILCISFTDTLAIICSKREHISYAYTVRTHMHVFTHAQNLHEQTFASCSCIVIFKQRWKHKARI